ncbi:MAG: esterase family protein [Bacteroidota bacterium]|nr:esterase family protein [Bacteroidota bacterium]
MQTEKLPVITTETHILPSSFLERGVTLNIYYPTSTLAAGSMNLLLINDGQDLPVMNFESIISELYDRDIIEPIFCVGISCGIDRRNEYGTAKFLDYKGRGNKSALYTRFIFEELLPFIRENYDLPDFTKKSFCGFSMGGLSALDIVWNHPEEFNFAGIFSGSLWWRSVGQDDPLFNENDDRIMHYQIKNGGYYPCLKFFFETGTMDETADRNNNGIIDSIDDTLSLIDELVKKGYDPSKDIRYLELSDGKHDVATWGKAFPEFLKWGWSNNKLI